MTRECLVAAENAYEELSAWSKEEGTARITETYNKFIKACQGHNRLDIILANLEMLGSDKLEDVPDWKIIKEMTEDGVFGPYHFSVESSSVLKAELERMHADELREILYRGIIYSTQHA